MPECMTLEKSNCRNCYKCIRACPVKSIRFSENQAHIVEDECIHCGACYTVCPQHARVIRNDLDRVRTALREGKRVSVSLAPSFVANYGGVSFAAVRDALLALGVSKVEETAIGATVVKKEYEAILARGDQSVVISSCCHSVNTLIQKYFPQALPSLAKVKSPMRVHCEMLKAADPDCFTVFIGPCLSKKAESDDSGGAVDCALTFGELTAWMAEKNVEFSDATDDEAGKARLFPISGGILRTMDLDESRYSYMIVDGLDACMEALHDIEEHKLSNCFIEMSACHGSCVNGPLMEKHALVQNTMAVNRAAAAEDFDLSARPSVDHKADFAFCGVQHQMPGSAAIAEILRQMGKPSEDYELNCGSCGYNTCREKAIAVFQNKADLMMCLPFLKEKAESFSDTIIKNTPNGIFVLNEQLELQQINRAGCGILNIRNASDVLGDPVVRILDPVDYLNVLTSGENVFEKRKYLAEYQKYVEETIIYDQKYHVIMSILKDVTQEETARHAMDDQRKSAVEITDKVVEKQMRVVQEIASLLGETTAETKIALTKLKESLIDE